MTALDSTVLTQTLAIHGGPKVVPQREPDLFHWPLITPEDEQAVIDVLRAGSMSGIDITEKFEAEWGQYLGTKHNLAHCNGTMALLAAMFGVGVGRGDEVICPSITYWASCMGANLLGATQVFADIDPVTLCIDPVDLARKITPRTRAVVVVHYCGHPADMDAILAITQPRGIKVIEDVSHAQGTRYKGRLVGSLGDVAGISMMGAKSFAVGEGGMLSTNDRTIYERAIAFCHHERAMRNITDPALKAAASPDGWASGLPLGGLKGRINQTCSAMGRVQLKSYEARIAQIQAALNRFWDLIEADGGTPGLRAHRVDPKSNSTMGGWYNPVGHYVSEELGGLPVEKFVAAVKAEGVPVPRGVNFPLHLHPTLHDADVFHDGKPTRVGFSSRDVRETRGSLPVSERLASRAYGVPWFKHDRPEQIARYAAGYRKVALRWRELL